MAQIKGDLSAPLLTLIVQPRGQAAPVWAWPTDWLVGDLTIELAPHETPARVERCRGGALGTLCVEAELGYGADGPYVVRARFGFRDTVAPMLDVPPRFFRFQLARPAAPGPIAERTDDGPTEPAGRPL